MPHFCKSPQGCALPSPPVRDERIRRPPRGQLLEKADIRDLPAYSPARRKTPRLRNHFYLGFPVAGLWKTAAPLSCGAAVFVNSRIGHLIYTAALCPVRAAPRAGCCRRTFCPRPADRSNAAVPAPARNAPSCL